MRMRKEKIVKQKDTEKDREKENKEQTSDEELAGEYITKTDIKHVRVSAPLRLCENFRTCKYCLCHSCYEKAGNTEKENVAEAGLPGKFKQTWKRIGRNTHWSLKKGERTARGDCLCPLSHSNDVIGG